MGFWRLPPPLSFPLLLFFRGGCCSCWTRCLTSLLLAFEAGFLILIGLVFLAPPTWFARHSSTMRAMVARLRRTLELCCAADEDADVDVVGFVPLRTSSARACFCAQILSISGSMVPVVISWCTKTVLCSWPNRHARAAACSKTAWLYHGSRKTTWVAHVTLRPTEPTG